VSEETLVQIWVSGLPAKLAASQVVVVNAVATAMVIVADAEAAAVAVESTGE